MTAESQPSAPNVREPDQSGIEFQGFELWVEEGDRAYLNIFSYEYVICRFLQRRSSPPAGRLMSMGEALYYSGRCVAKWGERQIVVIEGRDRLPDIGKHKSQSRIPHHKYRLRTRKRQHKVRARCADEWADFRPDISIPRALASPHKHSNFSPKNY